MREDNVGINVVDVIEQKSLSPPQLIINISYLTLCLDITFDITYIYLYRIVDFVDIICILVNLIYLLLVVDIFIVYYIYISTYSKCLMYTFLIITYFIIQRHLAFIFEYICSEVWTYYIESVIYVTQAIRPQSGASWLTLISKILSRLSELRLLYYKLSRRTFMSMSDSMMIYTCIPNDQMQLPFFYFSDPELRVSQSTLLFLRLLYC